MVWYFHLFQNIPQFIVIHTVKGFGIVNKAEIDGFLELSCFFDDPADVGNLISGSSTFSNNIIFSNLKSGAILRSSPVAYWAPTDLGVHLSVSHLFAFSYCSWSS